MTIIAAELNIEPPGMDNFDVNLFLESTEEEYFKVSKTESIYRARNNREYPWQRRFVAIKGIPFFGVNQFSQLNDIIHFSKKFKADPTIIMLYQPIQSNVYDFTFHFDGDVPYGFRICYGLDIDKPFLNFMALKDEYIQHARELNKIEDYMCVGELYTLTPKKQNTVLRINSLRHPHRVPLTGCYNRLVFIVMGIEKDYNIPHVQEIVDRLLE